MRCIHSPRIQLEQNTLGKLLLMLIIAKAIEFTLLRVFHFHHVEFVLHDDRQPLISVGSSDLLYRNVKKGQCMEEETRLSASC